MAGGSVISSVLALLLLIMGDQWTYTPELPGDHVQPRWPQTPRRLLEVIIAGVLQEAAAKFDDDMPQYVTTIWSIALRTALEWVLYTVLSLMVAVFKKDIKAKMGVKLQLVGLFLLQIACTWIVVDAVGLVYVDIDGMLEFYRDYSASREKWSDPLEQMILVI